jgi:hypothetical protein
MLIKLGCSRNLFKRFGYYNKERPFDTCRFINVSIALHNVLEAETKILEHLAKKGIVAVTRNEWFAREHLPYLRECICRAEEISVPYKPNELKCSEYGLNTLS